jgi:hypothetical protein
MTAKTRKDPAAFLRALNMQDPANMTDNAAPAALVPLRQVLAAEPAPQEVRPAKAAPNGAGRKKSKQPELKHFGGYVDDATFEKIALLKIRLKKDNSELIVQMVNEEYARLNAKRAFGDA